MTIKKTELEPEQKHPNAVRVIERTAMLNGGTISTARVRGGEGDYETAIIVPDQSPVVVARYDSMVSATAGHRRLVEAHRADVAPDQASSE